MGKKTKKALRELQAKLAAGDATAMQAIQSILHVPSYMRISARDPMKGHQRFKTTHPAKRSGRGMAAIGTLGALSELPHRVERLQMLRDRRTA